MSIFYNALLCVVVLTFSNPLSHSYALVVSQMVWFRENWYEEVLRQLRQALAKCYAVAFDDRSSVAEAAITPHTMNFVRKLVTTFGVGKWRGSGSAVGCGGRFVFHACDCDVKCHFNLDMTTLYCYGYSL